jgi:membrane protease YdiL (CAAX protease family)
VASALLFGAMHLNPWQALAAFISGLFYGWLYMRYRTIWMCMFFHGYTNVPASFMPFPVKYLENEHTHALLVMHPLWFDILGILLFLGGLGLIMVMSGEQRVMGNNEKLYEN